MELIIAKDQALMTQMTVVILVRYKADNKTINLIFMFNIHKCYELTNKLWFPDILILPDMDYIMANPGGMIAGVQIPMFNGAGYGSPGTSTGTLEFPGGIIITITGRKAFLDEIEMAVFTIFF